MGYIKSPAECTGSVCAIGQGKSQAMLGRSLYQGVLAGAYIGLGGILAIKVAAGMPFEYWGNIQKLVFGALFPVGLLLVLLTGGDLFTGNCMYMPSAVATRKCGLTGLLRNWGTSYGSNFVGGLLVAYFLGLAAGIFFDRIDGAMPLANYAVNLANAKCSLPWEVAFIRGVGCNWLVCLAIFISLAAPDAVSKVVLIWPPVTAFVALGFEHSVANMTFIPLGIFLGESQAYLNSVDPLPLTATWSSMLFNNLIPVTLGNIAGGGLLALMVRAYPAAGAVQTGADKAMDKGTAVL
ncbi:formate transporter [Deltaproteobacteria bacterium Smac51]|nr:formate transporter [Deltaproteobacteria bacterium Smac51]